MTVPHDEQPLTRRQLRELERQKPRKQQKEDAKAAEEAEAQRRAADALSAKQQPAAEPATRTTDATQVAAEIAAAAEASAGSFGAIDPEPFVEIEDVKPAVVPQEPATLEPATLAIQDSATTDAAPILSRRARRALSADHPFAVAAGEGTESTDGTGSLQAVPSSLQAFVREPGHPEPTDDEAPSEPVLDQHAPASDEPVDATGPIIAEIVHEDDPEISVAELTLTGSTEAVTGLDAPGEETVEPIVEELMVVDQATDPDVAAEEDEEFAEIDDTQAPEAVHIITVDDNPSGPILAPVFQAPPPRVDLTDASFDDLIASRGVGASNSVATTSALVLPSVPNHGDVGTALDETGEVIITGSIDLPMSLGSTGAAPADGLESADLDAFLDPESEVGSDVAPVSATRAISTHGSNSGLITPPKRSRANAPLILAVTAGVLAVAVIGLVVAAFVFRIF